MIRIDEVARYHGTIRAVDGISTAIGRGEIVGLLGHNGAGKTTLMKMITGFLEPTRGSITVNGLDVVEQREQAQRLVGYLPENAPLYPEMLVQEYLLMMAELRGVPAEQRAAAVGRAVIATGLQQRLLQPIGTLSKGYRQRVGLAQAIVHEPRVLVLDEPTNGLDPVQIQSIRELVRRLARHTTVILSTHILQEVEAVCERVLVLIDGRLAADAKLSELRSSLLTRMSLGGGSGSAEALLREVAGVEEVRSLGADPANEGFQRFEVRAAPGLRLTPDLVEAATRGGWRVAEAAPERLTLEQVFERLQQEHIRERSKEVAA